MSVKNTILRLLKEEDGRKTTAVYGGGFKPPTRGHFAVAKKALEDRPDIDEFIIFIGKVTRDNITQDQSLDVWSLYQKHLSPKVTFKNVSSPIGSIFSYAKKHPEENIIWVIGAREGNEEDFNDIRKRTKSLDKYPNIELKTIVTTEQVSGTAARSALGHSSETFGEFLPNELTPEEKNDVFAILQNQGITEDSQDDTVDKEDLYSLAQKYSVGLYTIIQKLLKGAKVELEDVGSEDVAMEQSFNMLKKDLDYYDKLAVETLLESVQPAGDSIIPHIAPLTRFMEQEGMVFQPYPTLKIISDDEENGKDTFGLTAYFSPEENQVVLYTYNRHPKDILRSYAHEMIHVYQNVEDRLNLIGGGTNVNEDDELEKIEREAYETGNILFRKWTNSLNEGKQVGTLYHYTTKENLDKIKKSNSLIPSQESKYDPTHRDVSPTTKSISFTRANPKTSKFADMYESDYVIVLDGDKLSNNYKIIPFQDYDEDGGFVDEMEERIYNKTITELNKYIIKIEKLNNLNEEQSVNFYALERDLDDMFDDLDIDINFTRHFKERVIQRNITKDDVMDLMVKVHHKYGENLQDVPDKHRRVLKHVSRNVDIVAASNGIGDDDGKKDIAFVTTFKKGPEGDAINNPKKDPVYQVTEEELPKNKWVDLEDKEGYSSELIDLVHTAYKKTPLDAHINSDSDVKRSDWLSIDFDKNPDIDATIFYRDSRSEETWKGKKIQGIGHDGSREAIQVVLEQLEKELNKEGNWVEASDALEHVLYKRNVSYVKDERIAKSIFPDSNLQFIGKEGRYKRELGDGKIINETIFGRPTLKNLDEKKIKNDPFGLNAYTMELARLAEDEKGEEYNYFLDMDGVIADFEARFKQLSGLLPQGFIDTHGESAFWKFIDIEHKVKFWTGIPMMDGAQELVRYLESISNFELLTAPSTEKQSFLGKRLWVKKHVGKLFSRQPKINFRAAKNKWKIKDDLGPFDVLIDDRKDTIDKWNAKGGTGIHHTSADNTINQLKQLQK